MHCSPYLSAYEGPTAYMPETLFQHFMDTKYYAHDREYLDLYEREAFLDALKSNEDFSKFWTHFQEKHPEKKEYFLTLTNEDEPFESSWVANEYESYRQRSEFEALSEEDRRILQNEFDEFRHAGYRAVLEGESRRLNCDIDDVKPKSAVLLLEPDHEEKSNLASLPDELFGRIVPLLDTLDVFNMTLVSKTWKRLIHNNRGQLKRAEHAMTTHFIRFTDWLEPTKAPYIHISARRYQRFSWCLTRWCCGISENLETLILDHAVPYTNLASLLQSCPNLKLFRIAYVYDIDVCPHGTVFPRANLQKLEVFELSRVLWNHDSYGPCQLLVRDIFSSSPSLRVFKGPLNSEDFFAIDIRNPVSNVFSKLIVLDLDNFTATALEILSYIENLQLKYLRLGFADWNSEVDGVHDEETTRNALHQLLPKLSKLEALCTSIAIPMTNDTIRLMTDLELNINWAVLHHSYLPAVHDDEGIEINPQTENNPLQPEVLLGFRNMLLMKNPDINLSEIRLVLIQGKTLDALQALNSGFTILEADDSVYQRNQFDELYDLRIKQRLGIEY